MTDKNTGIFDTTYIVCDVETTGLSPEMSRITEISLIKIQYGEIIEKLTSLINPKQHIPHFITNLTGISDEDVINKPTFEELSGKILKFINSDGEKVVFVGHNASFDYKFLKESFSRIPNPHYFDLDILCTCKLARRLLPKLKSKSLSSVATHFNIIQNRKHRAYDDTLATAKILINFLETLQAEYDYEELEDVLKFQNSKIYTKENKSPALKRLGINLTDIPKQPGVYFMKSRSDEILYIGKAKDLRERLSSYFHHNSEFPYKIRKLLTHIRKLDFQITNSELSALILESKLIKFHKPRFNTAIKRFRFHPFLKLDIQNDFPKLKSVYEIENDGAYYYGPFTSRATVRTLAKEIDDNFKLRKCEDKSIKAGKKNSNCMYFDIGKCDAPCNETVSQDIYRKEAEKAHKFLTEITGFTAQNKFTKEMEYYSSNKEFEKAAYVRDRLKDLVKVLSYQKVITSAINNKKIIIKCDNHKSREVFFIHNGKLVNTILLNKDTEFNQEDFTEKIIEDAEYLYFSLHKYTQHKYTQEELDEIKVISNWLALNREKNKVLEIAEFHTKEDIVKFIY